MFDAYSHYVAYGATDQQTARDLLGSYDGLLVPGTVAAFQREGTGGFVLTLSATAAAPEYVIDSRFPLFQQALLAPKKSHEALALLLDDPSLISGYAPSPAAFTHERTQRIVSAWVDFNRGYRTDVRRKFNKYAERLGEPVEPADIRGPHRILVPYTISTGPADDWWRVSAQMLDQARQLDPSCLRVIATETPTQLNALLEQVDDEHLVIWVSGLEELVLPADQLATYARTVRAAAERGQQTFALYGGFFHVLLGGLGLRGASHGIGYGEYRSWIELPTSGPPPARYYLRRVHRYVSQELAYQLYMRDRTLVECNCDECNGQPPIALDYHELMKHSVRARAEEIEAWSRLDPITAAELLETEHTAWERVVPNLGLPPFLRPQAERSYEHLLRWAHALRLAAS
ncbi:MAG: hypothetical protein JWO74_1596 [Solirubrobacterales bacterium]|nr:hypothetical protein [Solirubrobacterales bacterium]